MRVLGRAGGGVAGVACGCVARAAQLHVFVASQPVRYLACVFGRLVPGDSRRSSPSRLRIRRRPRTAAAGRPRFEALTITATLTPRQKARGPGCSTAPPTSPGSTLGVMHETPYPSFTLAVTESFLPGGHSPAYFAVLNQPLPASPFTWRDDPANFDNFPEFFLAHELAHQWWGQGVGWQNYHEQWLSEGFAQYFAALYAERRRGADTFAGDHPIDEPLGGRDLRPGSRVPRLPARAHQERRAHHARARLQQGRDGAAHAAAPASATTRSSRRCGGSTPSIDSPRRAPTRCAAAFETESKRDLTRFFEQWIYGSDLPGVRWTTKTEGQGAEQALVIRIEQQGDRVFDFPLTVTLQMADGAVKDVVVAVTDRVVEQRIPYAGALRGVQINRDRAALMRDES